MEDLSSLRSQIDKIDMELVRLFEARMECVLKVAEYKLKNNMEVLHKSREDEVIKRGINNLKDKKLEASLTEFLNSLMKISRELQTEFLMAQNGVENYNDSKI
jgi:chorismate mutase / prephenate dehydratase